MNILAVDASSSTLSAALQIEGCVYYFEASDGNRRSEPLLNVVDAIINTSGAQKSMVDVFACAQGPGSFTGLRIGFSCVKALSFALGKKYVCVPVLDAAALAQSDFNGLCAPVLEGGKNRFFSRFYKNGRPESEILDLDVEGLISRLPQNKNILFTGNAERTVFNAVKEASGAKLDISNIFHTKSGGAKDLLNFINKKDTIFGGCDDFAAPLYLRSAL
jgi:tRNA threonylcarbamoyladenosine biosynthesis protein TsaB